MHSSLHRREIEGALPTVIALLQERNIQNALEVVLSAEIDFQHTGFDNWNGGTELWTAFLRIPVALYVKSEPEKNAIEAVISENIKIVLGDDVGFWISVKIMPLRQSSDLKIPDGKISQKTRSAILDELQARNTCWFGDLNEIRFLERIYDLSSLPSYDSRYKTAEEDIWQHCLNNDDWSLDWIYHDKRFNLLNAEQSLFLSFVTLVVHPVVKRDAAEQDTLVIAINSHLQHDGWELVAERLINGLPEYIAQRKIHSLGRPLQRIKAVAAKLNADHLYEDLRRLERAGDNEPGEAIAAAKEIIESCCKLILDDRGKAYPPTSNFPSLINILMNELSLMPDGIDENVKNAASIKEILTSLGKIATSLAPLRNAYGKGHGRGRGFQGLQPRHARLAIGAASTFVDFMLDRHTTKAKAPEPAE